jgi:hypothetical protein
MAMKKDIGELYKNKFKDLDQEPPQKFIWETIEMKNEEMRFYRFSLKNFNIYYLSSIVVFSLLSLVALGTTMLSLSNGNPKKENNLKNDSTVVSENKMPKGDLNDFQEVKENLKFRKSISSNTPVINKNEVKNEIVNTDTIAEVNSINKIKSTTDTSMLVNAQPSKKFKTRRVVVIEQRDTIIIIDTLHDKKNKKRRN